MRLKISISSLVVMLFCIAADVSAQQITLNDILTKSFGRFSTEFPKTTEESKSLAASMASKSGLPLRVFPDGAIYYTTKDTTIPFGCNIAGFNVRMATFAIEQDSPSMTYICRGEALNGTSQQREAKLKEIIQQMRDAGAECEVWKLDPKALKATVKVGGKVTGYFTYNPYMKEWGKHDGDGNYSEFTLYLFFLK